jgi:hypothetical protein
MGMGGGAPHKRRGRYRALVVKWGCSGQWRALAGLHSNEGRVQNGWKGAKIQVSQAIGSNRRR